MHPLGRVRVVHRIGEPQRERLELAVLAVVVELRHRHSIVRVLKVDSTWWMVTAVRRVPAGPQCDSQVWVRRHARRLMGLWRKSSTCDTPDCQEPTPRPARMRR
jgi:hypothetical protein